MSYRVEVTATAEHDLDRILAWLSVRSLSGARHWFEAWEAATISLRENASSAALAPENCDHREDVFHRTFKTNRGRRYRVLFIMRDQTVFIINIRGAGQQFVTKEDLGNPDA